MGTIKNGVEVGVRGHVEGYILQLSRGVVETNDGVVRQQRKPADSPLVLVNHQPPLRL